jgi:hypothetical protein
MSREISSHGSIERESSGDSALGAKSPSASTFDSFRRGDGPSQPDQKSPLAAAVCPLSLSSAGDSDNADPNLERGSTSPKSPGGMSLAPQKRDPTSPSSSTLLPPPLQRNSKWDGIGPKAGGVLKREGRSPTSPSDSSTHTGRTPTSRSYRKR